MSDHLGIRFTNADLVPADEPVARWFTVCSSALNDLLLVNRWLVPNLENDGPDYINVYLGRLGASHLYEIAKFLHQSERRTPEVRAYLASLDDNARAAYDRVKAVGPAGTEPFAEQLEHVRNHFFHYAKLVPHSAEHEKLKRAMDEHAESTGEIMDAGVFVNDFRARFADDIMVELSFPEDTVDLHEWITTLSSRIADYLDFAVAATTHYVGQRQDRWEYIERATPESSKEDLVAGDG